MADRNGYIGRAPGDSSVIVARQTFQPTGVQTDFTFSSGYDPGYLDVYLNGSRLIVASDYTATDGSVVGLTSYADNGDVLECVAYKAFNLGSVNNAAGNFDVGVDLTVGNDTTITGYLSVSGTTTLGAGASVSYATTAFNLQSGVWTNTDTTAATNTTTGALIVSGGVGIAKSLFVNGNVSVGGTLTYEDVTNQDVVGLATFRSGAQFGVAGVGGTITAVGNANLAGIVTAGAFVGVITATSFDSSGTLVEAFSSTTTAYNTAGNLNISNGNVQFSSANLGGTGSTLNIISNTGINSDFATGQTLTVTGITAVNATTAFVNKITVDGVATGITTHWVGGSVPTAGGGSGVDLYAFNLLKTGSATYIIVANQTKTSA